MRRPNLLSLLVLGGILLLVVPSAVTYYTDWLWFKELGYEGIFVRTLNAQATVFVATFAVVFLFLFFNLRIARGTFRRPQIVLRHGRRWPADRARGPASRRPRAAGGARDRWRRRVDVGAAAG